MAIIDTDKAAKREREGVRSKMDPLGVYLQAIGNPRAIQASSQWPSGSDQRIRSPPKASILVSVWGRRNRFGVVESSWEAMAKDKRVNGSGCRRQSGDGVPCVLLFSDESAVEVVCRGASEEVSGRLLFPLLCLFLAVLFAYSQQRLPVAFLSVFLSFLLPLILPSPHSTLVLSTFSCPDATILTKDCPARPSCASSVSNGLSLLCQVFLQDLVFFLFASQEKGFPTTRSEHGHEEVFAPTDVLLFTLRFSPYGPQAPMF